MYHRVNPALHFFLHEIRAGYKTIRTIVVLDAIEHLFVLDV